VERPHHLLVFTTLEPKVAKLAIVLYRNITFFAGEGSGRCRKQTTLFGNVSTLFFLTKNYRNFNLIKIKRTGNESANAWYPWPMLHVNILFPFRSQWPTTTTNKNCRPFRVMTDAHWKQ
jgi:hypothetical protein